MPTEAQENDTTEPAVKTKYEHIDTTNALSTMDTAAPASQNNTHASPKEATSDANETVDDGNKCTPTEADDYNTPTTAHDRQDMPTEADTPTEAPPNTTNDVAAPNTTNDVTNHVAAPNATNDVTNHVAAPDMTNDVTNHVAATNVMNDVTNHVAAPAMHNAAIDMQDVPMEADMPTEAACDVTMKNDSMTAATR